MSKICDQKKYKEGTICNPLTGNWVNIGGAVYKKLIADKVINSTTATVNVNKANVLPVNITPAKAIPAKAIPAKIIPEKVIPEKVIPVDKFQQNEKPKPKQIPMIPMIPMIDLYEFKIEGYQIDSTNAFSKGFTNSKKNQCAKISTDGRFRNTNSLLSSCDVIETSDDEDWEKLIKEDFRDGFYRNDTSLFSLIKDIYYEYKLFESKTNISYISHENRGPYKRFCEKWWKPELEKTIKLLSNKYESFLRSNSDHSVDIIKNDSYIQTLDVLETEKIIMIGDVHGSVHTFLRHLFRFHRLNILNLKTFKLSPGFRLIFLGDVVDRGQFALEIITIIFKLMEVNNTDLNSPQIIYNRGNHEEISQNREQFGKELIMKCEGESEQETIIFIINDLYQLFPSAVILKVSVDSKPYRFWLCHGGFDLSLLDENSQLSKDVQACDKKIIKFYEANQQENVRWCDFSNIMTSDGKPQFNSNRGGGYNYNMYHVAKFMSINHINFIIRGHQDNYDNNYLFSSDYKITTADRLAGPHVKSKMPGFGLNSSARKKAELIGGEGYKVVINNNQFSTPTRVAGPITRLIADSLRYNITAVGDQGNVLFAYADNPQLTDATGNPLMVFPVLTISTNTDIDRDLDADSFVILRFDKNLSDTIDDILPISQIPLN